MQPPRSQLCVRGNYLSVGCRVQLLDDSRQVVVADRRVNGCKCRMSYSLSAIYACWNDDVKFGTQRLTVH